MFIYGIFCRLLSVNRVSVFRKMSSKISADSVSIGTKDWGDRSGAILFVNFVVFGNV